MSLNLDTMAGTPLGELVPGLRDVEGWKPMNVALDINAQGPMRVIEAPAAPRTIEETGLEEGFLIDLLCKTIYRQGIERATEMAKFTCLPVNVIEQLLEVMKNAKLIETLGQLGASMRAEMRWALSGKGKEWAMQALAQSEYVGPAPITIEQFSQQVSRQSIRHERLTEAMLRDVLQGMILPDSLYDDLGPAVNSFSAILLYGPPGNGKSTISNAVCEAFRDTIFIPHAIVVERQVIVVFDPTVHEPLAHAPAEDSDVGGLRRARPHDQRFMACARPAITTGGELTLDMLDLSFNPIARTYEAPIQMKAMGGVFVVDDFGRQRQTPQELLNRLIVPLEAGVDYLALQTGRKFQLPFDALVVFSTNIPPKQLVDEAGLRRLRYKILIDSPSRELFIKILASTARKSGMEIDEDRVMFIFDELYGKTPEAKLQGFHARFFCDQARALHTYLGSTPELSERALKRAWGNLFTSE
ncbi:MAG: ATPase [Pseudomonadota bacterium]